MIPWSHLDSAPIPGSGDRLQLYQRDREFSIRVGRAELMNSRQRNSEEALARLACEVIADRKQARVLVGGLGMGFTLAAALPLLGRKATLVVAELIPEVVKWNRAELGELTKHPLSDPRVSVFEGNVLRLMEREKNGFDAIMMDVDNGPEGFTREGNDALYGRRGLATTHAALRRGGVLTVWSAAQSHTFRKNLQRGGFAVNEVSVRSRPGGKGATHTVWVAVRDAGAGKDRKETSHTR
jgi:spermidine synthase